MRKQLIFLVAAALFVVPRVGRCQAVRQSARQIPIVWKVDVVVVGGSVGAVASAVAAADGGTRVMLIAPRPYLGDDLCGTLHLWLEAGETSTGELTRELFASGRTTTPLHVKKKLETVLLKAHVDFLLSCYPTDVLFDGAGQPAGIVIANRAGRQAIVAKVIIDATDWAIVAKRAGTECRHRGSDQPLGTRVVLGGRGDSTLKPKCQIPAEVTVRGQEPFYYEYSIDLDLKDGSFAALAEAEQRARDLTYRSGQLRASERIRVIPSDSIRGRVAADHWQGFAAPGIGCFCPRDIERVYVLSGVADVPASHVKEFWRPAIQEAVGRRVGQAAARQANKLAAPESVRVPGRDHDTVDDHNGDIHEFLRGLRPTDRTLETVSADADAVPILADVDIVIIGGGTSGACAAIGAVRRGANVLVVEYQEGLGGVGTVGLIGHPYHGQNRGFTREVPFPDKQHNTEYKMQWYRRQIVGAGGQVWFGVLGCGAYVESGRLRGAVVVTPLGRGVVLAKVVIDATGNGDIAVAAGADAMYGADANGISMQGAGLPARPLDGNYVNTDYLLVDESDMLDTWRALVGVRLADSIGAYDMGTLIQTRERRRVRGDHILSYLDQIAERTYSDSIVFSSSDYDSHGYPNEPFFALMPHTEKTLKANHPAPGGTCYTPYRCLLPRGLEGILVTGLGISMERDALAMMRMQRDMHNQGYAAGVAAAMAVQAECTPRRIDIKALQKHLVEIDNLPASILTDTDSFPLPRESVELAVRELTDSRQSRMARCRSLAIILTHSKDARPALRDAFASTQGDARLTYAKVLGFLGDREVVPVLVDALRQVKQWDAKIYQGAMAEYAHLPTPVDALILALGHAHDRRATPVILGWLAQLDADVTLSHHRAVALALEQLRDPRAAAPLARLLCEPGMRGHALTRLEPLYNRQPRRRRRLGPLREIVLARALYRCGDDQGLGARILKEYQQDVRGLFARHATAVLENPAP